MMIQMMHDSQIRCGRNLSLPSKVGLTYSLVMKLISEVACALFYPYQDIARRNQLHERSTFQAAENVIIMR